MKNYLMVVGLALAMVGCAHNRGGAGDGSDRQSGYDNNYKMPKTEKSNGSSVNGSSVTNGINSGSTNEINSGSTSDRSSGAGSQDNQSPTTPQN